MNPRLLASIPLLLAACNPPLTREEAEVALQEIQTATQASTLANGSVEVTTDFTIGEAVERAAEELRSFYENQLPCAEVTLERSTLSVEYGVNGECRFRNDIYMGTHTVTVSRNDMREVIVEHEWDGLTNGKVEVSGAATVTWNFSDPERHVVHDLEWTRFSDGRTGHGSGDRVQRPHEDGLSVGLQVDGERSWRGESGEWRLDIDAVKLRWGDPVPYTGVYNLVTPFDDKELSVSFQEKDTDRIGVLLKSGSREYGFDVVSVAPKPDASSGS